MNVESARAKARALDQQDELRHMREEFLIPSRDQIHCQSLPQAQALLSTTTTTTTTPASAPSSSPPPSSSSSPSSAKPATYLCGNSLGLQPRRTAQRIQQHLATWATQGVQGHFKPLADSPLPTWLDADSQAAGMMAPVVGAGAAEVAVMQTLTANLHFLLSAFYHPKADGRHKIIIESKAFPSDHFAVESQIRMHGLAVETSMITISSPLSDDGTALSTYDVQSVISQHAKTTAVLVLPGIQYYTGELLDISTITNFAHKHGIFVIWDLAHAVGNVPLRLHDWDVDAAVWCTYKYLNSGPGGIGGLFVHERLTAAADDDAADDAAAAGGVSGVSGASATTSYVNRLSGWWGHDKDSRFVMATRFQPAHGAAGFQLSNPSVLDITSLCASLEIVAEAGGIAALRKKSLAVTGFLESLLRQALPDHVRRMFRILTPADPTQRGAQLSLLLLQDGILDAVMDGLLQRSVIVDDRKPSVIRVAPAPLYNSFEDCVDFVVAFGEALEAAAATTGAAAK